MLKFAAVTQTILPFCLLTVLGLSALGFHYFAVQAFDVGTGHEYIPKLKRSVPQPHTARRR